MKFDGFQLPSYKHLATELDNSYATVLTGHEEYIAREPFLLAPEAAAHAESDPCSPSVSASGATSYKSWGTAIEQLHATSQPLARTWETQEQHVCSGLQGCTIDQEIQVQQGKLDAKQNHSQCSSARAEAPRASGSNEPLLFARRAHQTRAVFTGWRPAKAPSPSLARKLQPESCYSNSTIWLALKSQCTSNQPRWEGAADSTVTTAAVDLKSQLQSAVTTEQRSSMRRPSDGMRSHEQCNTVLTVSSSVASVEGCISAQNAEGLNAGYDVAAQHGGTVDEGLQDISQCLFPDCITAKARLAQSRASSSEFVRLQTLPEDQCDQESFNDLTPRLPILPALHPSVSLPVSCQTVMLTSTSSVLVTARSLQRVQQKKNLATHRSLPCLNPNAPPVQPTAVPPSTPAVSDTPVPAAKSWAANTLAALTARKSTSNVSTDVDAIDRERAAWPLSNSHGVLRIRPRAGPNAALAVAMQAAPKRVTDTDLASLTIKSSPLSSQQIGEIPSVTSTNKSPRRSCDAVGVPEPKSTGVLYSSSHHLMFSSLLPSATGKSANNPLSRTKLPAMQVVHVHVPALERSHGVHGIPLHKKRLHRHSATSEGYDQLQESERCHSSFND